MLFYLLYCNIIHLISLKITQAFHLLLDFAENQTVFWDFKIQNTWIHRRSTLSGRSGKCRTKYFSSSPRYYTNIYLALSAATYHSQVLIHYTPINSQLVAQFNPTSCCLCHGCNHVIVIMWLPHFQFVYVDDGGARDTKPRWCKNSQQ